METAPEIKADIEEGRADRNYFQSFKWDMFTKWAYQPEEFASECEEAFAEGFLKKVIRKIKRSFS